MQCSVSIVCCISRHIAKDSVALHYYHMLRCFWLTTYRVLSLQNRLCQVVHLRGGGWGGGWGGGCGDDGGSLQVQRTPVALIIEANSD